MTSPLDSGIYAVVKRYADAWVANDLRAIIESYHDEVVFHYFGRSPLAGTHRGKTACLAVLKQVREKTNRRLVSVRDVLAGETLAWSLRLSASNAAVNPSRLRECSGTACAMASWQSAGSMTKTNDSSMSIGPNPSLHPKCYSGLAPPAHSGEIKR